MLVEIYGKSLCPNCDKAKNFFDAKKQKYHYKSIEDEGVLDELINRVGSVKTVPQIIINNKNIGGIDGLINYFRKV